MVKVGVVGASGFTGAELMRLVAGHPEFELAMATADSQAGTPIAQLYPSLGPAYGSLEFAKWSVGAADGLDVVFLGLPHGVSQSIVPGLVGKVSHVVDLGADFRLTSPSVYEKWYGHPHGAPGLLDQGVYGLPELNRDDIPGATLIAGPGCYPTAATVALAPLLAAGFVEPTGLIVDAASGVSGAGRPAKASTTFCKVDEDFVAYGLLDHRHTPEIEQNLTSAAGQAAQVLFTPHLAPMNRGILATCYARPTPSCPNSEDLIEYVRSRWAAEQFVTVVSEPPSTKATLGSNSVHVTVRRDERTQTVIAIAALDNLTKGASGQAIQCANAALGLPEGTGLTSVGVYP